MRGIMNAGHGRNGVVIRTVGEDFEPRAFKVFGPAAYAWLVKRNMHVAQTLEDRSHHHRASPPPAGREDRAPAQHANPSPSPARSSRRAMVRRPQIILG